MFYENGKRRPGRLVDRDSLPIYKRWTQTSAECYMRGCRCGAHKDKDKCTLYKYCSRYDVNFIIKRVVLNLVREIGIPRILTDMQNANKNGKECEYGNSGSS